MPAKKYHVTLTDTERQQLLDLIKKGRTSARMLTRARILLLADEGQPDKEIATHLHCSTSTVCRIRKLYCTEDVEAAIKEKNRPGAPPKLNGRAEAMLTTLACSTPPEGHARWTLRLLAATLVQLELIESISHVTVGKLLKKCAQTLAEKTLVHRPGNQRLSLADGEDSRPV